MVPSPCVGTAALGMNRVGTAALGRPGERSSPIHGVMLSGFSREASRARHRDLPCHFPIAMRNRAEARRAETAFSPGRQPWVNAVNQSRRDRASRGSANDCGAAALARIPHLLLLSVWARGSARVNRVGTAALGMNRVGTAALGRPGERSSPIHGVMLSGFSREASRARHRDLPGTSLSQCATAPRPEGPKQLLAQGVSPG